MRKLRLLGLLAAGALLVLQSCKKNESNFVKTTKEAGNLDSKKGVNWNPGDVVISGRYMFKQYQYPSKAVCVVGNSTLTGAHMHHWTYKQLDGQKWDIVDRGVISGKRFYTLQNVGSGKVMQSPVGAVRGSELEQAPYVSGDDKQLFTIVHQGYTVYTVVNKATGLALTLSQNGGNPGADGAKILLGVNDNSAPKFFFFTNLDEFFYNPLLTSGADPWVVKKDGYYYYMNTTGSNIVIRKTAKMSSLRNIWEAWPVVVYTPPAGTMYSQNIWAPEMHFLDGKWYIYFAADNGTDANHRMHVIENANADPTQGTWTYKGKISDASNIWAIDGTVFQNGSNRYFIWSGWAYQNTSQSGIQQIYIAQMSNPWTISSARVKIAEPYYSWEMNGLVNEAPQIVKNPSSGATFIIYSGSGCWTDDYKLGLIKLNNATNPLNASYWQKKNVPVFEKSTANSVYAPGHCSFFKSQTGNEDWIIYHANDVSYPPGQACGGSRSPRMQKFTWATNGEPSFGIPLNVNNALRQPSGE